MEHEAILSNSFYSKENISHLEKAISELNQGKSIEHELLETEEEIHS